MAAEFLAGGSVAVTSCVCEETKKIRHFRDPGTGDPKQKVAREITYRDWRVTGRAGDRDEVEIVINDMGRIIFGRCTCPFFDEHLMNQGPCEHMLALFKASEGQRADTPVSIAATSVSMQNAPARAAVDTDEGSDS